MHEIYWDSYNKLDTKGGIKMSQYRTREQWSTAVDKELLAKLRQLSADTRIPTSRLTDEAIEDLLVKYNVITKEEKKNP